MRLTLWGIYQYDPTLFDNVTLPAGIDKGYVIDEIMRRSGDLFTYYQVPERLKMIITNWFNRNYDQFERMIAALMAEYDPIENYNRTEWSLHTPTETFTTNHTGEDTRDISTTLGSTSTNSRSAFDSSGYSPNEQTVTSGGDSSTDTFTRDTTDSTTNGGNHQFDSHIHGNIGVMTNQAMINEEIELRRFDIYTDIARRFEKEFLIDIY